MTRVQDSADAIPDRVREVMIFDRRPHGDHEFLIGLHELTDVLRRRFPRLEACRWVAFPGLEGYGRYVNTVARELERVRSVPVDVAQLLDALAGDERIENGHFVIPELAIELGVFDSTFLFFRGSEEQMHDVRREFARTEIGLRARRWPPGIDESGGEP